MSILVYGKLLTLKSPYLGMTSNCCSDAKNVRKQGRDGRDTRIQITYIYCLIYM